MKNKLLILIPMLLMSIIVLAGPAKRGLTKVITLKDGSTLQARLVGDEYGHFWLAENGNAYIQVADSQLHAALGSQLHEVVLHSVDGKTIAYT